MNISIGKTKCTVWNLLRHPILICYNCRLLCRLLVILKVNFANSVDPDQTAPWSSLIRVHTVCLYAKIGLKSLQKIFSRQHNQTTFSDTVFHGALRVKVLICEAENVYLLFTISFADKELDFRVWPFLYYEPKREKTYLLKCEPNEDSNQSAHPCSLIRIIVVRMKKIFILGYPKCGKWSITKTRLFKYIENFTTKKGIFSDKKFWYFSYFFSKHRLWILVRKSRRGGSNEYQQSMSFSKIRKIMYTL